MLSKAKSRPLAGKKIFFLAALFVAGTANAQITFQKTFGGTANEWGYSIQQTIDGGFIITGNTFSFGAGMTDVYLVKTDAIGDTLWTKTYGGSNWDYGRSVQQTADLGYIITGNTSSFGAGLNDIYLIKTDANGDTLWTKTYGGTNGDGGYSVQQTADGGYIITGSTNSYGAGLSDVYLVKTDASGNTLWTKTYGGGNDDLGYSVQQTTDGGYVITGHTNSFGPITGSVYLIKTDAIGDTLWTKTFGGTIEEYGYSVKQTTDGGYILTGYTMSFGVDSTDVFLIKTDAFGDTLWTKTYGGVDRDEGYSVQQTADGGYIIAGTTNFGAGWDDVYLIKTDASGDTLWTKTYGGTNNDLGYSVQQTTDGGYVITGYTYSVGAGFYDIYLIKTDSNGISGCNDYNTNTTVGYAPFIVGSGAIVGSGVIVNNAPTVVTIPLTIVSDACTINDSVWPGDANYDLIVDNLDLLPIGIAFGSTGPVRPGATINWVGQTAFNWNDTLINGINYKHVDCDGDGIIDFADTVAIMLNYGFTHTKTTMPNIASPIDPDFYVDIAPASVASNTPLVVDLNLGTVGVPADSIYGLAFTLNFNPLLVDSASINLNVINSWLGTAGTDMIKLDRKFYGNGQVDVGIVRVDQSNSSGNGKIGELNFTAVNNSPTDEVLTLSISDVTIIANDESIRNVNLGADSVIVQSSVGIDEDGSYLISFNIYPNPNDGKFQIQSSKSQVERVEVFDLFGRKVLESKEPEIDMRGYMRGVYFVRVGVVVKKVILQ